MVNHCCLILEELREPGPLEVVLGVGSGVMGIRKDRGRLQILILQADSKQTASRAKSPRTDNEVTMQTLLW
jgi:hypothetical protein